LVPGLLAHVAVHGAPFGPLPRRLVRERVDPGGVDPAVVEIEQRVTRLGIKVPALVDRFDDSTEIAYSGWPDRLYLIDREGRIVYKSAAGPFGFKPGELEAALKGIL
jgi:Iodothyronine deiodinase